MKNTYIFAPPNKTSIWPTILISEFLNTNGYLCRIVSHKNNLHAYNQLGLDVITINDFYSRDESLISELIFMQHNSTWVFDFFEEVVGSITETEEIKISFYPDGLGNATWGESFLEKSEKVGLQFGRFYSFGFVDRTTSLLFSSEQIEVINYSHLCRFFENNTFLNSLFDSIQPSLIQDESFFIAYRPWCTQSFHGGGYSFGNGASSLLKIYTKIIKLVKEEEQISDEIGIYFRGDNQYVDDCAFLAESFKHNNILFNLDDVYVDYLTLDPLIYFLIREGYKLKFISLDSTTFITVPFFVEHLQTQSVEAYFGCDVSCLEALDGGKEFYNKKLQ